MMSRNYGMTFEPPEAHSAYCIVAGAGGSPFRRASMMGACTSSRRERAGRHGVIRDRHNKVRTPVKPIAAIANLPVQDPKRPLLCRRQAGAGVRPLACRAFRSQPRSAGAPQWVPWSPGLRHESAILITSLPVLRGWRLCRPLPTLRPSPDALAWRAPRERDPLPHSSAHQLVVVRGEDSLRARTGARPTDCLRPP